MTRPGHCGPAEDEETKGQATSSALAMSRRVEPWERGQGSRGASLARELCKESYSILRCQETQV